MSIETTVYLKDKVVENINSAVNKINISKKSFISMILRKYILSNTNNIYIFSSVRYQKPDNNTKWFRFHITLENDLYEKCLDMRKFYKRSVSALLTEAIREYLYEIIWEFTKKKQPHTDNYNNNYIATVKICDTIPVITIAWGLPDKITLKKFL